MKNVNIRKRILCVVLAVLMLALGFFGGFLTRWLTTNKTASSYEWVIDTIKKHYYEDIPEEEILNSTLKGLSGGVLDIYSSYYTKEEYAEVLSSNAGNKSGLGVTYRYSEQGDKKGILILKVTGNSPAYMAGLKVGTYLFGGTCGEDKVSFKSNDDFASFLSRRAAGEQFTLNTDRGDITLAKSSFTASYAFMATNSSAWECSYLGGKLTVSEVKDSSRKIEYLPDGAAYMSLSQFYGNAAEEMAELIGKFNANNCTSLILDLRGNGGGYVDVMRKISSLFTDGRSISSKLALTVKYKDGKAVRENIISFASKDKVLPASVSVKVLADADTASASEALLGVMISDGVISFDDVYLSDYSKEYLGFAGKSQKTGQTYGKGIMQTPFTNYRTGEVLKLTTAKLYWPNGHCIHGTGLTAADGCKLLPADWIASYGDPQLKTAVQLIY